MRIKRMAQLSVIIIGVAMATSQVRASDNDYRGFQVGDIMVRMRALAVVPDVTSNVSTIHGNVDASTSFEPEADISYFFTQNIAVEAIAAITRHHLTDNGSTLGNVDLGRVSLLPPTVTAQYHFLPKELVNPYLGAGINYTVFFDSSLPAGGAVTKIKYENNFGTAIQAGADFHVQGNWFLNVDAKHLFLSTTAKINNNAIIGKVNLDPTIVGLGIGYKF